MSQIRIVSRHEYYRRCGEQHTRAGRVFSADHFTAKQLARLEADPHLVVQRTGEPVTKEPSQETPNTNPPPPKDPAPAPKKVATKKATTKKSGKGTK